MLDRMKADVSWWADKANAGSITRSCDLDDATIGLMLAGDPEATTRAQQSLVNVVALKEELEDLKAADTAVVQDMIPMLTKVANFVDLESGDPSLRLEKLKFVLRRSAGMVPQIYPEYLFGALLSSESVLDLQALNPYLSTRDTETVLGAVAIAVLRASRVGCLNRAINACLKLSGLLVKTLKLSPEQRTANKHTLYPTMVQSVAGVATWCGVERYFVSQEQKEYHGIQVTEHTYDPRFLIFEFTWNIAVSYTHLRAHETPEHLVCRLLLEKKKTE
eukprot:TRINITY_DN63336_c0_g2_i1.p1 TRINITY_DN63336_c0_g2~~TRINITY_DN63336_c0_g2_i1.p1  ORF type:complete len:276 (-),score=69.26 TRINITY_DN63336_c0_g2_i1:123-950(-)